MITRESTVLLLQFTQYMAVIREMLKQMESEQQAHLTQLSKMEEQTRCTAVAQYVPTAIAAILQVISRVCS